jgi:ABC-type nickel/cobalt efflux system permease component RcnA
MPKPKQTEDDPTPFQVFMFLAGIAFIMCACLGFVCLLSDYADQRRTIAELQHQNDDNEFQIDLLQHENSYPKAHQHHYE